jgi:hypothetical protein
MTDPLAVARQNIIEQIVDGAPNTITPSKLKQLLIETIDALSSKAQPFSKVDADGPPTINDDGTNSSGNGTFVQGSKWYDQVNDEVYLCLINTTGNAFWAKITLSLSDLGTAAALNVGTGANEIVQLDAQGRLPPISGAQLTNIGAVTQNQLDALGDSLGALAALDTVSASFIAPKSITPIKMAENILADGTDLNTVIDSGSYRLQANGVNWPSPLANYGQLIVSKNSDTFFQMLSYFHNNEVYTRTGWGIGYTPTFTTWKKLETDLGELHLQHQQPSGVGGGYAGSTLNQFVDYPYNTEIKNTISGVYSISNKFYLPVGTYKISARARGQNSGDSLLLLHAYSGGVNKVVRGDSCFAAGSNDSDLMILTDEFQVVSAGEFAIRRRVTSTTGGSNDLGRPVTVGMNEIYGDLQIKKVA